MFGSCFLACTSVHLHRSAEGSAKPLFLDAAKHMLACWSKRVNITVDEHVHVALGLAGEYY